MSPTVQLRFWVARGNFYETILNLSGTFQCYQYLDKVKTYEMAINRDEYSSFYIPPFLSEWLLIFMVDDPFTVNITLRDEILAL